MATLAPAPDTLGISSPALGPWFDPQPVVPALPLPGGDLAVTLSLGVNTEWLAPAGCLRSFHYATSTRPKDLVNLRQEDGTAAFADDTLIVLLSLLPEVELRLWALTQPIPSPDGTALPPVNTPARPRIRYLAMEVPAAQATSVDDIAVLQEFGFTYPGSATSDADKAAYFGLTSNGSMGNAAEPAKELRLPESNSAIALKNRTGALLQVKLWSFDYRGRALDPGAVANWWTFLAGPTIWDNLWADASATALTTSVQAGNVVQICSANEGPLSASLTNRLNLTNLTQITGSDTLYTAGAAPAIALTATPSPDDAPIPRLATLPLGNYAPVATATPFAGWTGAAFPAAITRDFTRIGFLDIEQHVVGLTRADSNQASVRTRIAPARNLAAPAVMFDADTVNGALMNTLNAGTSAMAMSPVMDLLWGQVIPPAAFGTDALPDALIYTIFPLAGEGTTSAGGSSEGQSIVVHFEPGDLPANCWIRIWTHGLDTETGLRFRQDGGAALSDGAGQAYVVLPIPDGVAAPDDEDDEPVLLSFDAMVFANGQNRYFAEERYERLATVAGSKLSLGAPPDSPVAASLWICEQGVVMNRAAGQYASGQTVLVVPDDPAGEFSLVDLTSLDATDCAAATLINAPGAGDTLIITDPAFGQTPTGDMNAGPNGSTLVERTRALLAAVTDMGHPIPSQERREMVALETTSANNAAVIGAMPGRASNHEAPPPQTAHAGVPAHGEIHGPGISLAGPATNQIGPLMQERRVTDMVDFISNVGVPVTPVADPGGTSTWAAALETTSHGMVGDATIRAFLAATSFLPGQSFVAIKNQIEAATGFDLDTLIDTTTFNDDALATAFDRMIIKTRDGARAFADSILAAISRAEDFIYIETPAIDPHAAQGGALDLIDAIKTRWTARPGLIVLLCVPEKFLPDQTAKLKEIRKAGISAALKSLQDAGGDRIALFSPVAGPGRPYHMAGTTVVVDDALLLTGSTHLWRRGLTFDSSLAVGLFDENVTFGRPTAVRAARLQLLANALGLPLGFLPDDPEDCLGAIVALNSGGGIGRVKPGLYPALDDPTSAADLSVWNPDGRPGVIPDWLLFFAALTGGAATEFNNAIR